jgi:biotin carboxyl carrier protein
MKLKITLHGVAYEVEVEVLDAGDGFVPAATPVPAQAPVNNVAAAPVHSGRPAAPQMDDRQKNQDSGKVTSPIAGSVVEIKGQVGQVVHEGDVILVIEAMKMNTSIAAPGNGKITAIPVAVGDSVREGQVLAELEA